MSEKDPHARRPEETDESDFPELDDEPTIIIDADLIEEIQEDPGYSVRPRGEEHGDSPATEEMPSYDDAPMTEQIPSYDDAPMTEQIPSYDDAPMTEQIPSYDDAPMTEQIPNLEEAPITEQIPLMSEAPGGHGPITEALPSSGLHVTEEFSGGSFTATEYVMDVGATEQINQADDMLVLVDEAQVTPDTEMLSVDDLPELDNIEDITAMLDDGGGVQLQAPLGPQGYIPFAEEPRRRSRLPLLALVAAALVAAGIYFETWKQVPYLVKMAKAYGIGGYSTEEPGGESPGATHASTQQTPPITGGENGTDPGISPPTRGEDPGDEPVLVADPVHPDPGPDGALGEDHPVFRAWLGNALVNNMSAISKRN